MLEDDTGALSTEDGAVVLDLQPLVIQLGERVAVVGDVAERFGPDAGRIEIMEAGAAGDGAGPDAAAEDSSATGSGSCRSLSGASRCGSLAVDGARSSA